MGFSPIKNCNPLTVEFTCPVLMPSGRRDCERKGPVGECAYGKSISTS